MQKLLTKELQKKLPPLYSPLDYQLYPNTSHIHPHMYG